jgi:DNA-binding LacI/PurR family transcriptional regulator
MENTTVRPTAREIASRCGVSVATVSRVLNSNYKNGFSVRKELHQKITKLAEELGYRPNLAAQNLAQQKTNIIAFLGLNTTFGWPTNIYQLTCETAIRLFQSNGYNICTAAPNLERDNTELPPWRVDGVVVLQECSQETIEEMERIQLPYVVVNGVGGPSCSSVVPDDVDATRRAINHLLDLGHKCIAYAGPSPEHRHHASTGHRHSTYLSELNAKGLEPISGHETLFTSGLDFLVSSVLKQKATAIIAYDHVIAMKILHDANILNIEIPRQVSLICFNDEKLCDLVVPPLTTVGVPSAKMGRVAAETLLKKIESPEEAIPECVKLQEDLVIRSSTAEPFN